MTTFRAKWMNPDFRRDAKTDRYCEICQRDLKPDQPHRRVMFELDRYEAIHAEDWEIAEITIRAEREHRDPIHYGLIGMDCARRLGLDYSRPATPAPAD